MLNNYIYSASRHVYTTNPPDPYNLLVGSPSYTDLPDSKFIGALRYSNNKLEVFTGSTWQIINSAAPITLSMNPDAENALDWAIKKQREEKDLEMKAKDNPAIADLLDQRKKIDDQIKVIDILTKDDKVGTN
jgi:hypothetical protein